MGFSRSRNDFWGEFDSLFDEVFGPDRLGTGGGFGNFTETVTKVVKNPSGVRGWRQGDDLKVTVDVPGVDTKDIKVRVVDDEVRVLTVRDGVDSTHMFRAPGTKITQENVSASVENGVLTVVVKDAFPEKPEDNEFEVPLS